MHAVSIQLTFPEWASPVLVFLPSSDQMTRLLVRLVLLLVLLLVLAQMTMTNQLDPYYDKYK